MGSDLLFMFTQALILSATQMKAIYIYRLKASAAGGVLLMVVMHVYLLNLSYEGAKSYNTRRYL